MRKIFGLAIFICCYTTSCTNNVPSFTTYTGVVVEQNSMSPLPDLPVRITDGTNIYSETVTNDVGQFSMDMAHNSTLGQLYIYIDGNGKYPSKKIDLIHIEESKYDYGMIYLYNETDASLFPIVENVSWDYLSDGESMQFKDVLIVSSYSLEEAYIEISSAENLKGSKKILLQKQTNGKYSCIVNNLVIGEQYFFQIVATNTIGTGKSELYCRTFGFAIPKILELKEVTINSAVISIRVIEEPLVTLSSGICWSTSSNPTISDFSAIASSNTKTDIKMNSLDFTKESYYVRAFAKNANGISYSEVLELPINNPYSLPTFKSDGYTYTYVYMGKADWYTAFNTCKSLIFVFDDWTLPNYRLLSDFISTYYMENREMLPLPMWSMRPDENREESEAETFLLTTNGYVLWPKNGSYHYYAVREL